MRIRALILTFALLSLGRIARAQQLMIPYDGSGCQVLAPYAWVNLPPYAIWTATVDLSQCGTSHFGWYDLYGFIMRSGGADSLSAWDGIELQVTNLKTGETVTSAGTSRAGQDVFTLMSAPAKFQLTAVNKGRKNQKIRLSWLKVVAGDTKSVGLSDRSGD